jgi:hypothetical protein
VNAPAGKPSVEQNLPPSEQKMPARKSEAPKNDGTFHKGDEPHAKSATEAQCLSESEREFLGLSRLLSSFRA